MNTSASIRLSNDDDDDNNNNRSRKNKGPCLNRARIFTIACFSRPPRDRELKVPSSFMSSTMAY